MGLSHNLHRLRQFAANVLANRREAPVAALTYHRVGDPAEDPHLLTVSPENFRRQLALIRDRFPVLRFDGDWAEWPDRMAIIVTFDDGYADNWELALPILREFAVPATVFVTADAIDATREFPWDGGRSPQRSFCRTLRHAELRELAADPLITIGSHTLTHPRLAELSPERQRDEIIGGRDRLTELLGFTPKVFSYPFGNYSDWNEVSRNLCREAGFLRAAANYPGQIHSNSDPFALPRHVVRNWSGEEFQQQFFRFRYL